MGTRRPGGPVPDLHPPPMRLGECATPIEEPPMPRLLVPAKQNPEGVLHDITPQNAGWTYVGFSTRKLAAGGSAEIEGPGREVCLVVLSGRVRVTAQNFDSGAIGERADPFSGLPWSVYL